MSILGKLLLIVGSKIPGPAGDILMEWGSDLEFGKYNSSNASTEDTIDMSKECQNASAKVSDKAMPIIAEQIKSGKKKLRALQDIFQDAMPTEKLNDPIIDQCFEHVKQNCEDYIAHAISIDDEAFKKILETESKSERTEKVSKYIDKLAQNLINNAQEEITQDLNAAVLRMHDLVEDSVLAQEEGAKQKQKELKELQEHQGDIKYRESLCSRHITDITYLECIRSQTY